MENITQTVFGLIAGNGAFPKAMIEGARKYVPGVKIYAVAFVNETRSDIEELADEVLWCKIGQITKPLKFLKDRGVKEAVMAGGLAPTSLFDLRPDLCAIKILARNSKRNADTLFGAIVEEALGYGITILSSTTYMDDYVPKAGDTVGPSPSTEQMADAQYGMQIAKEMSRLNIGQVVILREGTVLAVEAFEGTNECIKRGASLGKGKAVTMVKIPRAGHDMRFDVPVIGEQTLKTCAEAGVSQIVVEAGRTIFLEKEEVAALCKKHKISLHAL